MPGQVTWGRNLTLRSHFGADRHPTLSLPTLYFALFKGDPSAGGVEPTAAGGYARVAKANDATLWGTFAASDVQAVNKGSAGTIAFPVATGVWSITDPLDWWAIFDNAAGGNLRYFGPLTQKITVTGASDQPRLPASTLSVSQPV